MFIGNIEHQGRRLYNRLVGHIIFRSTNRCFDILDLPQHSLGLGADIFLLRYPGRNKNRFIIQRNINVDTNLFIFDFLLLFLPAIFHIFNPLGCQMIYHNRSRLRTIDIVLIVFPFRTGTILNRTNNTGNGNLNRTHEGKQGRNKKNNVGKNRSKQRFQNMSAKAANQTTGGVADATLIQVFDQRSAAAQICRVLPKMADRTADQHKAHHAKCSHNHRALAAERMDNK